MKLLSAIRKRSRNEKGFFLMEVVIAVALFGVVGITFVTSLSTGFMTLRGSDERTIVQQLAQAQMEETRSAAYVSAPTTYPTTITAPDGYSVTVSAFVISGMDSNTIQSVKVTVSRGETTLLELVDYKANR